MPGSESQGANRDGNDETKASQPPRLSDESVARTRWIIGLGIGIFSTLLGAVLSLYQFNYQLEWSNRLQEIHLSRDLAKSFYDPGSSPTFRGIRMAIERCKPLYTSWGGAYDNDQINTYLGFFDDLGLYFKKGVLSTETIDHFFGPYLIEAYFYPEIRKYIKESRAQTHQSDAFREFELLAMEIEKSGVRRAEIDLAKRACPVNQKQDEAVP